MATTIPKAVRKKVESRIYAYMDAVDKTHTNTEYYKRLFSKMSDAEFLKMFKRPFAIRFHQVPFKVEPTMNDIVNGLKVLGVPLCEEINLNHIYKNSEGVPVRSKLAEVIYMNIMKMKQISSKKNTMSTDIEQRDPKSGLLTDHDKNGLTSDREEESLIVQGLDATAREFTTVKADYMNSKSAFYNTIKTKGQVRLSEIEIESDDSVAKNLANTYLLGAHIYTNMLNEDYMLPRTIKNNNTTSKHVQVM